MSVLARLLHRDQPQGLVIEPMRRRHLSVIRPIENAVYPKPWSQSIFLSELDLVRSGERHYIVARDGGAVVGYAGLMFGVDEAHVTTIACDPACWGRGVGSRLLAELAWAARDRGMGALTLEVRVSNDRAQRLYRRFGLAPAGIRPRYYENSEDAIVMWCHDIASDEYARALSALCPEASR